MNVINETEAAQIIERYEASQEPVETAQAEDAPENTETVESDGTDDALSADSDQGSDEEFEEPRTLDDIAAELDLDVSELYKVKVPYTDANGQRRDVSISEWKDRHQELDQSKKFRDEAQAERQRIAEQAMIADSMAKQLQSHVVESSALIDWMNEWHNADLQQTNWEELRATDPEMWAAKRIEVDERARAIAEKRADTERLWREAQRAQANQQQVQQQAMLAMEERRLYESMPDWNDIRRDVLRYLSESHGFSDRDFISVRDHRQWVLAKKAMEYDRMMNNADVAKKKILKTPKRTLKGGARHDMRADQFQKLRANLKRTGKVEDAAKLYQAMEAKR